MNASLQALLVARLVPNVTARRTLYYKFKRTKVPPLPQARESPYIVGPYLKPDYMPTEYMTDPIQHRNEDDFDHMIYEPILVEPDETRRVRLLLIKDVEGLGVAGQVVDAPYRFGASKLVAMRKADYFTDFAKDWYKFGPRTMESASSALSPRTARLLRSQIYQLPVARTTQIQPWHISLALRLSGCVCPIEAIVKDSIQEFVDEGDVPHIKCTIVINNHERVEVRFTFAKQADQKSEENHE